MSEHTTDDGMEDFDAFWTARNRKGRRVRVMGEAIELPPSIPLQFELEARKLQRSKREKDVTKLVGILFGADAFEKWAEKGMDLEQFQLLLAWGPRAIVDASVTLEQVAEELAEREDAKDGEADPT